MPVLTQMELNHLRNLALREMRITDNQEIRFARNPGYQWRGCAGRSVKDQTVCGGVKPTPGQSQPLDRGEAIA